MSIGIGSAQITKDKTGAGAGDNLGNHTATQDLEMAANDINNTTSLNGAAAASSLALNAHLPGTAAQRDVLIKTPDAAGTPALQTRLTVKSNAAVGSAGIQSEEPLLLNGVGVVLSSNVADDGVGTVTGPRTGDLIIRAPSDGTTARDVRIRTNSAVTAGVGTDTNRLLIKGGSALGSAEIGFYESLVFKGDASAGLAASETGITANLEGGDLITNVPTGKTILDKVNGATILTTSATAINAASGVNFQKDGVNIPSISSTDTLTNKTIDANSNTLSNIGSSEVDRDEVKTRFRDKRWWIFIPAGGSMTTNGAYGAITSEGTRTNNTDADGKYTKSTTAASTNADAGTFHTTVTRRSHNVDIEYKLRVNTTATRRAWIGLFASDPMASDAPTAAHIGLRVSTSAGSTQFVLSHADGTTQAETDLLASDTAIHTIRIVAVDGSTKFQYSWDGGALTDVSTNIPASTDDLGSYQEIRTLANAAANLDIWYEDAFADK